MNSHTTPTISPPTNPHHTPDKSVLLQRALYITIIVGLLALGCLQSKRSIQISSVTASTWPKQSKITLISLPGDSKLETAPELEVEKPIEVAFLSITKEDFASETLAAIDYLALTDTTAPEKKAPLGPPLQNDELLAILKEQAELPLSSLGTTLELLEKRHPNRDSKKVTQWARGMARSYRGASFEIATHFQAREDLRSAFYWFQKSAIDTSAPEAFYQTGSAQLYGKGTPTNYIEARKNLMTASDGEHGDAAYLLGIANLSGLGGPVDNAEAYRFFQVAIDNGSHLAYAESARMSELGTGIPRNIAQAIALYVQGAQLGDRYCMERLVKFSTPGGGSEPLFEPVFGNHWKQILQKTEESTDSKVARLLLPTDFLTASR